VVVVNAEALREEVRDAAARFLRDLEARRGAPVAVWKGVLAPRVDHSLLRPEASAADVDRVCAQAVAAGCAAVCVASAWVPRAVAAVRGSAVRVCGVVGFPFGYAVPEAKALEARRAVEEGAEEIDTVANLGALASGDWAWFVDDVAAVVDAARGRPVKVILESALHAPAVLAAATCAACRAGAAWVKTSTGFHPAGGATRAAVAFMWLAAAGRAKVKAAAGIRTCEDALGMVAAGAERLGTSRGPDLAACQGAVEVRPEDALDVDLVRRWAEGEVRFEPPGPLR
jgi:deoxyribose-phosphate aldolase